MKKKIGLVLVLALAMPMIALASGGQDSAAQPEGPVELVEMDWFGGFQGEVTDAALKVFMDRNPNITVKRVRTSPPGEHYTKILTMIAGGMPPNTANFGPERYAEYVEKKALVDLNPLAKKDKLDTDNWYPVSLDQWNISGQQFAFPQADANVWIYYNRGLFDKEGVPYPTDDWTWADFLAVAKKLTKDLDGDGTTDQWGFLQPSVGGYTSAWALAWIYSNGGRQFNDEVTRCLVDSPEAIEALQFVQDLIYKHKVAPESLVQPKPSVGADQLFIGNKAAMWLSGTWNVGTSNLRETMTMDWDIALMPQGPSGPRKIWLKSGGGFVMFKGATYPEQTWQLVKFLSSEEYFDMAMIKPGIALPALRTEVDSDTYIHPGKPPYRVDKAFLEKLKSIQQNQVAAKALIGTKVRSVFNEMEAITLNQAPAAEVAKKVAAEVNALLK